jgi:hypothetical protein
MLFRTLKNKRNYEILINDNPILKESLKTIDTGLKSDNKTLFYESIARSLNLIEVEKGNYSD